jgi:hypothetical protein
MRAAPSMRKTMLGRIGFRAPFRKVRRSGLCLTGRAVRRKANRPGASR